MGMPIQNYYNCVNSELNLGYNLCKFSDEVHRRAGEPDSRSGAERNSRFGSQIGIQHQRKWLPPFRTQVLRTTKLAEPIPQMLAH